MIDQVRNVCRQWAVVVLGAGLIAACGLNPPRSGTPTPRIAGTDAVDQTEVWISVVGQSVSFECPESWDPVRDAPADGVNDHWTLDIPQGELASIGFAGARLERFRPPEVLVIFESDITIGGKPGFKWLRMTEVGGSDVVYEYFTTGLHGNGVFSLSVLLPGLDPGIERKMDRLVQTVVFKEED
jgi:hypothetical protein